MTNAKILAALTMTTSEETYTSFDGQSFTISTWMYRCDGCNQIVGHEDTDENVFSVWGCECRDSDENEALIWKHVEDEDDRRQAEFWETEQESLRQAEARWSGGEIA
jgi:hypothetical protein